MIFFDIDDTLVTHRQSQRQAALLFWEKFAQRLPFSKQEFPDAWDAVMQKHFAAFAAGQISFREQRLRRMQEIFSTATVPLSEEEADAYFQAYLRHYEESWTLFDDVVTCLNALSHHKLGIISNGDGEQQRRKLRRLGIDGHFTTVIISGDFGVWKPKPEIFWEACQQASVSPGECLYIGDNLTGDCLASQAAGLRGIWLNRDGLPIPDSDISAVGSLTEFVAAI